ncbi:sigma 54-interacting transcriptional regulator [bacterium]|nr:sigma 54-interacting transcriptional regulator [bacterium]
MNSQTQHILTLAAFFEDHFEIDWILEQVNLKATQVLIALDEGVKAGFLREIDPATYCFVSKHKRIKLLSGFKKPELERRHRIIANILLLDFAGDYKKACFLAPHLLYLFNDLHGCRWLLAACDIYLRELRTPEAMQCYYKALDDLSLQSGDDASILFVETLVKYSESRLHGYNIEKTGLALERGVGFAEKLRWKTQQGYLTLLLAVNHWYREQYDQAGEQLRKGLALLKNNNDPGLQQTILDCSYLFHYWRGCFSAAVSLYEESVADVEEYTLNRNTLLTEALVGVCYAYCGQVTQGLGMLDAIQSHCLNKGLLNIAEYTRMCIAHTLLNIGCVDDALQYLNRSTEQTELAFDGFLRLWLTLMQAFAHYLKGDNETSLGFLKQFLEINRSTPSAMLPTSYLLELSWAAHRGLYPAEKLLSLEKEIKRAETGGSTYYRGMGHRFRAFLQQQQEQSSQVVLQSLNLSLQCMEQSGHVIGIAKTRLEIARQYLLLGDKTKAEEMTEAAAKTMPLLDKSLIPDELRPLMKDLFQDDHLLKEILTLGRQIVTIRNNKELVQYIISAANRITGAERGAIFDFDKRGGNLNLRAAKNLTIDDVGRPVFRSSLAIIKKAALTGEGLIQKAEDASTGSIRSCIAIPMALNDEIVGVLYHDNRLLTNVFHESFLEILAYFAALAAIAMDNAHIYEENRRLTQKLMEKNRYYEKQQIAIMNSHQFIGESQAMKKVFSQIDQVAATDTTVLITGETGVGKELVAESIHRLSDRKDKPFIRVNCSAFSGELVASELFGHEKGAFTGADQRRIGRFELADGGTLFLDEIGEIPLDVQVRLLRTLQTREYERLGGSKTLQSDFRLITATNRNLGEAIQNRSFREDLFYRLNVFPIIVPPLRERKDDIPLLAAHFVRYYSSKIGKKPEKIKTAVIRDMMANDWPGNVRELKNSIERGVILNTGLDFRISEVNDKPSNLSILAKDLTLKEAERTHILWALEKSGWKIQGRGGCAQLLDIHHNTLKSRMKKLNIKRPTA